MKFWLATANLERIERCLAYGIFEGVITNPHVVAQEKREPKRLFAEICSRAPAAYYQLKSDTLENMSREAQEMVAIDPAKMRIKVPATVEGLGVISQLAEQGLDVMATVVPTTTWMIFATAAGARRIAPYSGMLQKRNLISKMDGVRDMQETIHAQQLDVEICTGLYNPTEVASYARMGVKSGFIWDKDVESFLEQPLVPEALEAFTSDWNAINAY